MRRLVLALVATLGAFAAVPALAANQGVSVGDNFFAPSRVAVKPGESVTWTNPGPPNSNNQHNVRFDDDTTEVPPAAVGPWTRTRSFTAEGTYRYFCEIHGGPAGGGMAGVVYVNSTGSLPPIAMFTVSPNPALVGQTVSFDAAASSPSGSIVKYEWDLDGDGSFETDTGTTASASRSYAAPQTGNAKLRVTDTNALTDMTTRSVRVDALPEPEPKPNPPSTGQPGSPAQSSPKPPPVSKPGRCSKLKGKKRAVCIRRSCRRLKGAKRRACIKKVTRKS